MRLIWKPCEILHRNRKYPQGTPLRPVTLIIIFNNSKAQKGHNLQISCFRATQCAPTKDIRQWISSWHSLNQLLNSTSYIQNRACSELDLNLQTVTIMGEPCCFTKKKWQWLFCKLNWMNNGICWLKKTDYTSYINRPMLYFCKCTKLI